MGRWADLSFRFRADRPERLFGFIPKIGTQLQFELPFRVIPESRSSESLTVVQQSA
jgi:hypothetical protein